MSLQAVIDSFVTNLISIVGPGIFIFLPLGIVLIGLLVIRLMRSVGSSKTFQANPSTGIKKAIKIIATLMFILAMGNFVPGLFYVTAFGAGIEGLVIVTIGLITVAFCTGLIIHRYRKNQYFDIIYCSILLFLVISFYLVGQKL